jgi:hypothetical protein
MKANTKYANVVQDAIVITATYVLGGETILETNCQDYDHFASLPQVVSYNGVECGKTGWSSDRGYACYKSGAVMIARKVR